MKNVKANCEMSFDRIMASLPAAKSDGDIEIEYGPMLDRAMELYRRAMRQSKIQQAARATAELVVSLKSRLKSGFGNFVRWSDSLVPSFDMCNCVLVTRGTGAQPPPVAFTKDGYGCSLSVSIENVLPDSATVRISLLSNDGSRMRPFELTVMDADTNQFFLKRKTITIGDAVLNGMTVGNYIFAAVHEGNVVTLKHRIAE